MSIGPYFKVCADTKVVDFHLILYTFKQIFSNHVHV